MAANSEITWSINGPSNGSSVSLSGGRLSIGVAGTYEFHLNAAYDNTTGTRTNMETRASTGTSAATATPLPTGVSWSYHRNNAQGNDSTAMSYIGDFANGDFITFWGRAVGGGTVNLLPDGTRVIVKRLPPY